MKSQIKSLKVTALSMLATVSIGLSGLTPSLAHAGEWRTISGSSCVAQNQATATSTRIYRNYLNGTGIKNPAGAHLITCPLPTPALLKNKPLTLVLNYRHNSGKPMLCRLYTSSQNSSRVKFIPITSGRKSLVVFTKYYSHWGNVSLSCRLYGGDQIRSISYYS